MVLAVMTGYGQATDWAHSQEAGFDYHLVKPAKFNQVQKILDELALVKCSNTDTNRDPQISI